MISDNTPTFTVEYDAELTHAFYVRDPDGYVCAIKDTMSNAKAYGFSQGWAFLSQSDWKGDE
jgi:hypothetical protein